MKFFPQRGLDPATFISMNGKPVEPWYFGAVGTACGLVLCMFHLIQYRKASTIALESNGIWHEVLPRQGFGADGLNTHTGQLQTTIIVRS